LIQPSKFENVAANLDALDLELSQTNRLYNIMDGKAGSDFPSRREVGGDLMESLDLQTGYKGVMDKRQTRL